ncbi:MAG: prepilin-type N-terminal cleavage/methylation domain-containing protein [Desulfococcus multivorans]|jgi:Tfp pilus assembly protein PilV|nr:prepilin-type N-terminal cleavage/methylation domain-containing protein [Desulfococcus multivorans]
MPSLPCNDRGITLIESVIAILIVSIGLVGLLSMQPSAWRTTARTDYLGRAAMILSEELNRQELHVMNPCNHPIATGEVTATVYASGQATPQAGDIPLTVRTTTTLIGTNLWRVTVRVTWPPLNATGITESIVVSPQANFRFICT